MSETLSSGLTITIPTLGETNWDQTIKLLCFQKISEHDHTGGGKGVQISTSAIADDAVTGAKIRLPNNTYLRARNAANSADIDLIKVNASNNAEIGVATLARTGSLTVSATAGLSLSQTNAANQLYLTSADDIFIQSQGVTGDIFFSTNGTNRWAVDPSGHLVPIADISYDIGSTSARGRIIYTQFVVLNNTGQLTSRNAANSANIALCYLDALDQKFYGDATDSMIISGGILNFRTGSTNRWQVDGSGNFTPGSTYSIGTGSAGTGGVYFRGVAEPSSPGAGGVIFIDSGTGALRYKKSTGTVVTLAA